MKPLIGLTSQDELVKATTLNRLNYTYIRAVEKAGGIPIIIPNLKNIKGLGKIISSLDGLIFTGGEDISPLYYNEEPSRETTNISYTRDKIELALFKIAYKKEKPILGLCRGMQLINVALGGSLYQDIPSQIQDSHGHMSSLDIKGGYHSINIFKDTRLFHIFKEEKIVVNSQHHQSVKDLGENLKINSLSPDGVIEGIEHKDGGKFVLGLQFHPEAMAIRDERFSKVFTYFIKSCLK